MRRVAFAVRAIQLHKAAISEKRKPLMPYVVANAATTNTLEVAWQLTESQKKMVDTKGIKFTCVLQICDPETLEWELVYRGFECKCTADDLAPSTLYLFRLKVFEKNEHEESSKWSESVSGQTRDEQPSVKSLHKEIEFGNHQEVSRILQLIPIAACSCFSEWGYTSLQVAVANSDLKMVKLLMPHGDVNEQSFEDNGTALMLACAAGKQDIVEFLLQNGASLEIRDRIGLTALHHSLFHIEIAKLILDAGAAVDAADSCGWTPLMRAVLLECDPQVVSLLINHGANVNHRDTNGLSCLAAAVFGENHQILKLLCEGGADVHGPADCWNNSALELASEVIISILAPVEKKISCPPVVNVRVDSLDDEDEIVNQNYTTEIIVQQH